MHDTIRHVGKISSILPQKQYKARTLNHNDPSISPDRCFFRKMSLETCLAPSTRPYGACFLYANKKRLADASASFGIIGPQQSGDRFAGGAIASHYFACPTPRAIRQSEAIMTQKKADDTVCPFLRLSRRAFALAGAAGVYTNTNFYYRQSFFETAFALFVLFLA